MPLYVLRNSYKYFFHSDEILWPTNTAVSLSRAYWQRLDSVHVTYYRDKSLALYVSLHVYSAR